MTSLIFGDSRALLGAGASPIMPHDPQSVTECFSDPGLTLTLVAEKHISTYSAWLWEGNDGQAYFSKRLRRSGRTLAWKPGATVERVLSANPSMRRALRR